MLGVRNQHLLSGLLINRRGFQLNCPICSFEVANPRGLASHFRHQSKTHPAYKDWKEDQRWEGKREGVDYVVCLIDGCGHRAARLQPHLKGTHKVTLDQYRERFPGSLTQSDVVAKKCSEETKRRLAKADHSGTKTIYCPICNEPREVSKYFVPTTHEMRCPTCLAKVEEKALEEKYANLVEQEDFVVCQVCGYRGESLIPHLRGAHPELEETYREVYPGSLVTARNCAIRDKVSLRGRQMSYETRRKMSRNAGRWNKGLTKEIDDRVSQMSENMKGRPSWSKGLTKESDPRLLSTSENLKKYHGEMRTWDNGMKVALTEEELAAFALPNGKVQVGKAAGVLGYTFKTVKKECRRLGLETFTRCVSQGKFLELVSQLLSGAEYEDEWNTDRFINPLTGHRFKFDGYFSNHGLIVEFHGSQHYTWPNWYMDEDHEEDYLAMRERDRTKRRMIEASEDLTFFCVREDEPWDDEEYVKDRLVDLGVLGKDRERSGCN